MYSANLYLLLAVGNDFYYILRTSKYNQARSQDLEKGGAILKE